MRFMESDYWAFTMFTFFLSHSGPVSSFVSLAHTLIMSLSLSNSVKWGPTQDENVVGKRVSVP